MTTSGRLSFGSRAFRLAVLDTPKRRLHAIRNRRRQLVRPLRNGLRRDSDCGGCAGVGPAQQTDGFGLEHVSLNHAFGIQRKYGLGAVLKLAFVTDSPDWTTFGKRLEHAMALRSVTDRKKVAGALRSPKTGEMGVSVAAVGQVLSGTSIAMTAENTARVARLLGVDFYWLATGEGQPGENVPTAAELKTMDALRTIGQLNAETHAELVADIEKIADGLMATHKVLSGHGVTSYVTPAKATKHLDKPKPAPTQRKVRR